MSLAAVLPYLADLTDNNDRAWFEANRARYEAEVREPALAFIGEIGELLPSFSRYLVADDRRAGGSLMRVFRDTRFSKDKTPYKTNVGIRFAHIDRGDVHAPGLYVHLALDGCFLGAGAWRPEPEPLEQIRRSIADDPDAWLEATSDREFTRSWKLDGESLKRVPRGFDAAHRCADDLRRRDFIATTDLPVDWLAAPDLARRVMDRFASTRPFMQFVTQAVGAEF